MIRNAPPSAERDGGDPPCWSHLVDPERPDIVDRDDIERLVRNFYRDAAMDDLLGPVFEAAHVNWNAHIATLIDFWSWQLLGQAGYVGQPLRAHEPVNARTPLTDAHFARWVELFCDTVDTMFDGPCAEIAKGRGRKMATAMQRLLGGVSASGTQPIEPTWRFGEQPTIKT
ncbi:MAG: hypothetical protein JWN39_2487 [Ilumatobacteraceae bacterium]|nr:hypothetical protein [Ilumatobacteraceae bacterium]